MKKFAVVALTPLFAAFLWAQQAEPAQEQTTTTTTTKTTTWNGTLVDAACQTTHTEHTETTSSNPNESTSRTETTRTTTDTTECPVTTTTTSFGVLTPEGKFIQFDEPSNTKVVEIVKSRKAWKKEMEGKRPIRVQVVGTPNGDTVVMETIK